VTGATHTTTFEAMTTAIAITSVGVPAALHRRDVAAMREEIAAWDLRFSRFRPNSAVSRLNAASGTPVTVDTLMLAMIDLARKAALASGGRVDAAILPALEAAGYDRSIEALAGTTVVPRPALTGNIGRAAWDHVRIDRDRGIVRFPSGMRIDPGGLVKGMLADHLAAMVPHWPGGAISIGGDLRAWGTPPDGSAWRLGIESPREPQRDIATVHLGSPDCMGIATSATTRRAWTTADGAAHHLIDPATGEPARTSLLSVTACAPTATAAEIAAKSVLIASVTGPPAPSTLLDARWALLVESDLTVHTLTPEGRR
jgi:thiamine biosynthesis lipoprotein